jgi:ABC-2 type transport system permease protein
MISIGMVASFLTGNLTVSYILGAIFCSPLIAVQWIDAAPISNNMTSILKSFSIAAQFELFGRGIFNLSSIIYFGMITSTMLYLSMVMIGRRHWTTNRKLLGVMHYTIRTASLLVIGLSVVFICRHHDLRADMTEEKLSTLSPATIKLLKNLNPEHPIIIEAFLSSDMPDSYLQTRLNIISTLDEIQTICRNVSTQIHLNIQPNTNESLLANQRYGIKPKEVAFAARGQLTTKSVFLGIAFKSGLNTLTLPFIDKGLSVEYELVHALYNVSKPIKKRVGVLKTDAALFGRVNMRSFDREPNWSIIDELKKQYTLVEVDPKEPIAEKFDVLLAVQPSALAPNETQNFIDAVKNGQPTVIFEDPLPIYVSGVAGTSEERSGPGMMGMFGRGQPKGSLEPLWQFLGVRVDGSQVIWQDYSPIRKFDNIPFFFIFLDNNPIVASQDKKRSRSPFTDDPIAAELQYLMIPFSGHIQNEPTTTNKFTITPVLRTFMDPSGVIMTRALQRGLRDETWKRSLVTNKEIKNIAVRIAGELAAPAQANVEPGKKPELPEPIKVNVLLVADIDLVSNEIFLLRQNPSIGGSGGVLDFDNVNFVLNSIDSLAGDDTFLSIRCRRPKHRTLSRFDQDTDTIRNVTNQTLNDLQKNFNSKIEEEQKKLSSTIEKLRSQYDSGSLSDTEVAQRVATMIVVLQKKFESEEEQLKRNLNIAVSEAEVKLNEHIRGIQGRYKLAAVAIPPIPPLIIALSVFFIRRIKETEGIPKSRLKRK